MELVFIIALILTGTIAQKCQQRDYGNGGTVCVCNTDHCDTVERLQKLKPPYYAKYTSNKAGARFEKDIEKFQTHPVSSKNIIVVERDEYQEILGWGGAFTDATGINIKSLGGELSEKLMRSYFSEDGIEYSLCRVPIGATDFSTHPYTYHEEEDEHLSKFKLAEEDFELKIPLIHQALNLSGNGLKLFASAWIAPKWMKFNAAYAGFLGFIKWDKYQAWALYALKFLEEYKKENITFWGITTGNEPSLAWAGSSIPSVAWTVGQMQTWLVNNLGPTLRNSSHSDTKIMTLDDQRIFIPLIDKMLENEKLLSYVDGTAVHWYWNNVSSPQLLTNLHDKYPEKFILATEACRGDKFGEQHVILGSWQRGEEYASDIIENVNHWVTGWLDWNMALDTTGGPTYINNNVDSPIIVNATGGEFYKQPMYYAIGHFSKFVPRGSVRLGARTARQDFGSHVPVASFRRPDGGIVVVILNKNDYPVFGKLQDERRGEIVLNLTSNSLTSIIYW